MRQSRPVRGALPDGFRPHCGQIAPWTAAPEEIAAFLVLLCVAGNDTTRHSTTHAVLALDSRAEQKVVMIYPSGNRDESV